MNGTVTAAKTRSTRRRPAPRAVVNSSPTHPIASDIQGTPPAAKDKTLFTPGPLTTSLPVKQAMLRDAGSWHFEFNAVVASVRDRILRLAGLSREAGFEAILLQRSATFGVEAVFATAVPPTGRVLVLANGAYGERMISMLQRARIEHAILRTATDIPNDPI